MQILVELYNKHMYNRSSHFRHTPAFESCRVYCEAQLLWIIPQDSVKFRIEKTIQFCLQGSSLLIELSASVSSGFYDLPSFYPVLPRVAWRKGPKISKERSWHRHFQIPGPRKVPSISKERSWNIHFQIPGSRKLPGSPKRDPGTFTFRSQDRERS